MLERLGSLGELQDQMQCDRAWVEINLEALTHNVRQLKQWLAPKTDLMAVVKADAYGHGAIAVARTALAAGATWLGVATVSEGIQLRRAGIEAPILILGATHTPDQIRAIAYWRLDPTLCTPQQAQTFSETLASLDRHLPVHLKIDTGMSRLGMPWQEAVKFVQAVQDLPHLEIASVYSHLATADDPDPTILYQQHQRFEVAIAQVRAANLPLPRLHLANSAATLADRSLHYDMVRVGLATYGLYPAPHLRSVLPLRPVMQVKARITQVKHIQPGTGVSYGHRFVADRPMDIATVGIGYADGVPRNLSNRMTALLRGQPVAQLGSVTMDQLMLDMTSIDQPQVGEIVTLLGRDGAQAITADDWAELLGTISWEILCGFKHRLPRVAVGQPQTSREASILRI